MKCAHCEATVELTWARYFHPRSAFGRHTCPSCGRRFRLEHTVAYYVKVLAVIAVVAAVAFAVVLALPLDSETAMLAAGAVALIVIIPIDRRLDNGRSTVRLGSDSDG